MERQGARGELLRHRVGVALWVGLSLVGFLVGFMLVFGPGMIALDAITGDAERLLDDVAWVFWLFLTAGFALGGAGLAAGQWLLLRRHVSGAGRWIGGMAAGNAVLALLYLALYDVAPLLVNEVLHNVAGGVVIGIVQLPVVLRLGGRGPRWPLVTVVGMLAAATMSATVVHGLGGDDFIGGALGMAVYGLLTGLVLQRRLVAGGAPARVDALERMP